MRLEVGIIALLEEVLGAAAERRAQFEWLQNKPSREHFGDHYDILMELYVELNGDWGGTSAKTDGYLTPDAYFPEPYHFIFEFDELQHFTQFRELTFRYYPENVPLAYAPGRVSKVLQAASRCGTCKGARPIPKTHC